MQKIWIQSLEQEDPLEESLAAHSIISCLENHMDGESLMGYSP